MARPKITTSTLLGGIALITLSAITAIQHSQITALKTQAAASPTPAVVNIDQLGLLAALAGEQAAPQLFEALENMAAAGYIVVDQKSVLTAPDDALLSPLFVMELAGIEVTEQMRGALPAEQAPEATSTTDEEG